MAPPPAPVTRRAGRPPNEPPLEQLGLYDAVERLYEARSQLEVGRFVGRALLNYFRRVLVLRGGRVIGHAGVTPQFSELEPKTRALLEQLQPQSIHDGETDSIPRAAALAADLRIGRPRLALIAAGAGGLLFYGDNEDDGDAYEDLHDLEMLFKEAQTASDLLPTAI